MRPRPRRARCAAAATFRKATASADGRVERPLVRYALEFVLSALSNAIPEPTTRSRTVRVTSTSPGPANAETRAPMCTAIPATPPERRVISPAWTPHRTSRPLRRASSRILQAQRTARVEPSKVARIPSPAASSSLPSNAASAVRTTCSKRSSATLQVRSPSSAANCVEPTTSTNRTVARTRSQSPAPLDEPVMNSSIAPTRSGSAPANGPRCHARCSAPRGCARPGSAHDRHGRTRCRGCG